MPKPSFELNENQYNLLKRLKKAKNFSKIVNNLKISKAMFYRYIKALENKGLIKKEKKLFYKLTTTGKIALI